jgi:hypothetical protein
VAGHCLSVATFEHHMTTLPPSPFVDATLLAADPIPLSLDPIVFRLDEKAFWQALDPGWSWQFTDDDPPPAFISDPRPDFLEAVHRDLAELTEQRARAA